MNHFYQNTELLSENSMFTASKLYQMGVTNCRENGTVIEVGSWVGQGLAFLAVEAANVTKNISVISIDAFLGNPYSGEIERKDTQWEVFRRNLASVWKDLFVIKSRSHLAAEFFADDSVDFVFIDADHSLEAVRLDLAAWWPKVCSGGIFSGHDYRHPPVKQALDEFTTKNNIQYKTGTPVENTWYIFKE